MTEPVTDRWGRLRRWFGPALVVSLGVNLAVLGLIAGLAMKGPPPPPAGPGGEIGLWRYGAALPEPFRGDLGHDLRASRGDWAGPRDRLRAQSAALAAALTAEPYEPAAVAGVLESERELLTALTRRGADLLLAQIARMDPDQRADYAAALTRRGPPHRRP